MKLPSNSIRAAVRTELGLGERLHRRQPVRLIRLSAAAAMLWSLAAGRVEAQAPYRQEVLPGFSSLDVGDDSSPNLVDIDGDGDLDAIVGWDDGTLRYFANIGSSSVPAFVEVTGSANPFDSIDVGLYSSPELVDLDGDGDLDATVGGIDGTLRYFTNAGSSSAPTFVEAMHGANPFNGIDVGSNSNPSLADLDGDGDLDAIVGEFSGTLRTFANTGSLSAPAFVEAIGTANPFNGIDVGYRSSPELVDLDGDGDFDAVVGKYFGGPLRYFANTGSSSAPAFVEPNGTANPFDGIHVGTLSSPETVDLDGDGDLDAIIGAGSGLLEYFANTGSPIAPAFLSVSGAANPFNGIDVGYASNPSLADLDGDGDLDAIVGESSGFLRYFVNTGSSSAPTFVEVSGTAKPFDGINVGTDSSPEMVDLDGDGDLDTVVGNFAGILRYFANTGSSSAPAFIEASGIANPFDGIDVGNRSNPTLADLDGDSDLDAVVGELFGILRYFANTGSPSALAFVEVSGTDNPFDGIDVGGFHGSSNPDLMDLDGDGDLDALVGESGGTLVFFRSLAAIFSDGFESGDTSRWSLTVSLVNLQPARAPGGAPPDR